MTGDERSTLIAQAAILSTAVLAAVFHAQLDRALALVYGQLLRQWWFTHDTFEPALSASCFLVFLTLWCHPATAACALLRTRLSRPHTTQHSTQQPSPPPLPGAWSTPSSRRSSAGESKPPTTCRTGQ